MVSACNFHQLSNEKQLALPPQPLQFFHNMTELMIANATKRRVFQIQNEPRRCSQCERLKSQDLFSSGQWGAPDEERLCMECKPVHENLQKRWKTTLTVRQQDSWLAKPTRTGSHWLNNTFSSASSSSSSSH
jgi:hypothetical protein